MQSQCLYIAPMPALLPNWQLADRFPMSPGVEGPRAQSTSSLAPRGLHRLLVIWPFRHSKTPWQQKKGTWGQEPMQFTCSSFGQQKGAGTSGGAIKILQINYTKKKANLYTKSVQGLHFAVIICTNSAEGEKKKRKSKKNCNLKLSTKQTGSKSPTFVVDLSISINVCFSDHLIYFLVGQLLS